MFCDTDLRFCLFKLWVTLLLFFLISYVLDLGSIVTSFNFLSFQKPIFVLFFSKLFLVKVTCFAFNFGKCSSILWKKPSIEYCLAFITNFEWEKKFTSRIFINFTSAVVSQHVVLQISEILYLCWFPNLHKVAFMQIGNLEQPVE